jgi:hypothetical protein
VTLATRKPAEKTTMSERIPFESPVKLQVGAEHTLRTVNSVQGASEVLIDWPHARRGPFYQSAREVVEAAIAGKATAEEAREAFAALAAHAGVIVE